MSTKIGKKVRKIELIFYGHGTREILELDNIDLSVDFPSRGFNVMPRGLFGEILKLPKIKNANPFNMKGEVIRISRVGKKYLRKSKGGKQNEKR